MIPPYGKIFAFGKVEVQPLIGANVILQEKIDGSQFSFRWYEPNSTLDLITNSPKLQFRSKGQELIPGSQDKMFNEGIEAVQRMAALLKPNWIYRGEYLRKPKHNTLVYERIPTNHVIIFDIQDELGYPLTWGQMQSEALRAGFEPVPCWNISNLQIEDIQRFMAEPSILGGIKEGMVAKAYDKTGPFGGPLMGKYVSEAFKEVNKTDYRLRNPTQGDIIEQLINKYLSSARWEKAINHLREAGKLVVGPEDIGPLMKEVSMDVLSEERPEIERALFEYAWPKISRGIVRGLPQWYKEKLLKDSFESADSTNTKEGI